MGMKLKSGADLCGFELSRFCVQNDVAIPDAPASGRKYFHTGTGMEGKYSLLNRERIFTGATWRSAAYVDDLANLDLATNADYLKLKEQVDLLSGEVDTDAIISNMKEVTAFLEGFAEDANLMEALNKKLDKTGGTISGELTVDGNFGLTGYISTRNHYLFVRNNDNAEWVVTNKNWNSEYILLHSGNIGDYKAGGIISIGSPTTDDFVDYVASYGKGVSVIENFSGTSVGDIGRYDTVLNIGSNKGRFGRFLFIAQSDCKLYFQTADDGMTGWSEKKTIAFTDSTVAAAKKLVSNSGEDVLTSNGFHLYPKGGIIMNPNNEGLMIGYTSIDWHNSANTSSKTIINFNSSGNVTIGASDLAGTAFRLFVSEHMRVNGNVIIGASNSHKGRLRVVGEQGASLVFDVSDSNGFSKFDVLNNGNVLIGTTTDNGAKLQVNGYGTMSYLHFPESDGTLTSYIGRGDSSSDIFLYSVGAFRIYTNGKRAMHIDGSQNVGIGLTNPSAKLHVSEDIVANGTIACKGVAAEGSVDMGAVDMVYGTMNGDGSKRSWTFNHGLTSANLVVNVYEYNNGSWDMILTDVDIIGTTKVTVTFGTAPASGVQHKVVIIGGVGTEVIGS